MKIKLSKATKLKTELENSIDEDNALIRKWNSVISGNTREVDIDKIEEIKEIKSEFLIELNIAIQEANFKKAKEEKFCNAYFIKKLSELQRERKHLSQLDTTDGDQMVDKKKIKYSAYLKFSAINLRLKSIDHDINSIKDKLTNFNNQIEISIKANPKLKEIFEKVGIEL